jgi:SAM-dependent methyltransferase
VSKKSVQNKEISSSDFIYTGKEELDNMALMVRYNQSIIHLIKKYMGDPDSILDFGAGIGTLAEFFDKKKIICLEIDQDQQRVLKNKGFKVVSDLERIANDSMSFVYSSNVLEHIEDDNKVVHDLYEKVTPKGRILFYVPAFPLLYSSMDKRVGHFRRYTKERLRKVVEQAGFTIEYVGYRDCLGFFATLLYKLIGSREGTTSKKSLLIYDRFLFPFSHLLDHVFSSFVGKNIVIVARKEEI